MPYTVEDYRNELEQNVLKSMTPERKKEQLLKGFSVEELLKGIPSEQRLRGVPTEEIEAFLRKSKKKQTRRKKS